MKSPIDKVIVLAAALICFDAAAGTYKCLKDGKSVYSDTPCASNAARVDAQSDSVSRSQRIQAESVYASNRGQLSELEYRNMRNGNYRGQGNVVESNVSDKTSSKATSSVRRVR